ncbi:MAG: hypothetical protein NTZ73_01350 [Candidatus Diapherotrites archaeon]|nr:hypothetical protein [Candidatus Diapherotrites archaeon]
MDKKPTIALLICLICLFSGFIYSFQNPSWNFLASIPLAFLVLGFFLMGALFFGYLAFLPHIFYGLAIGTDRNAAIFLYIFPITVATYAGAKLGFALESDFKLEKYFLEEGKSVLAMVVIAVLIAIAIEIALPQIISMIPEDFLGMNIKEGETTLGFLDKLAGMVGKP